MRAGRARVELARRLRARRSEIVQAVMTRVHAVADPSGLDPVYAEGLHAAIGAAVDYGLEVVERGEEEEPPPPAELLAQARIAARNGVSLDTVLRRYVAGHALLGDFLVAEAENGELLGASRLQRLLRTQTSLLEGLLAAVSEEHTRAAGERFRGHSQRLAARVERLLAGEPLDVSTLDYDFDGFHLGILAAGEGADGRLRACAAALDCRPLVLARIGGMAWAWLGSRRGPDPARVQRVLASEIPAHVSLALGEPASGLEGWRLTHRQAKAALAVALRGPDRVVRYADVAVLASILRDELLRSSLREIYLAPLSGERDDGKAVLSTLRAYFAAERNVSSAATQLGVSRQTVLNRIRTAEERLGRPLSVCVVELEVALRMEGLDRDGGPVSELLRAC